MPTEQALQLVPENARLWCLLGFVHHKLDHIEDAKACYLKSVELDPEQGQPRFLYDGLYGKRLRSSAHCLSR